MKLAYSFAPYKLYSYFKLIPLDKGLLKYISKMNRSPSFQRSLCAINFFCLPTSSQVPTKGEGISAPKGYPCEHDYVSCTGNGRIPYETVYLRS